MQVSALRTQTTVTSSSSRLLSGLDSSYSPPGCKTQTAACPMEGALKRLLEDFRSLLMTLCPLICASPLPTKHWMECHPAVLLAGPQVTRPETLQSLSSRVSLPPLAAWLGLPGPGRPPTAVTLPDQCRCGVLFLEGPAPRAPQPSCAVGHWQSCGTGQADKAWQFLA